MNWYIEVLKKYAVFKGRARRKEFWFFVLFNMIISLVLLAIDLLIGTYSTKFEIGILNGIYLLAVLIPGIAVTVRRLHDVGRTGWWIGGFYIFTVFALLSFLTKSMIFLLIMYFVFCIFDYIFCYFNFSYNA